MRVFAAAAVLGAVALAPAAASAQSYVDSMAHNTPRGGAHDTSLGTSDHGVPPEAQAQDFTSASQDYYQQWDYTGWSGLTRHEDSRTGLDSGWSARKGQYVQAIPPRR